MTTSLSVAGGALLGYRDVGLLTALAAIGLIATFAASLLLAREALMAVSAFTDEKTPPRAGAADCDLTDAARANVYARLRA